MVLIVLVIGITAIIFCSLFQSSIDLQADNIEDITYCNDLNIIDIFNDPRCQKYEKQFVGKLLLMVSIPAIIAVIKELITRIIDGLAYFRRFGTFI